MRSIGSRLRTNSTRSSSGSRTRSANDGRVYVDDDGHRVFRRSETLIACNVEEVSKRERRIYFTVDVVDV